MTTKNISSSMNKNYINELSNQLLNRKAEILGARANAGHSLSLAQTSGSSKRQEEPRPQQYSYYHGHPYGLSEKGTPITVRRRYSNITVDWEAPGPNPW